MSLETARTEYLNVGDVRFAFRRLGPTVGTPLILLQHFTGTMDSWDPEVMNSLAETRPVIAFNNLGIGTFDWPDARHGGTDGGRCRVIRAGPWSVED
jgi:pimeloyl-ACP methyl ester carboxylesterase